MDGGDSNGRGEAGGVAGSKRVAKMSSTCGFTGRGEIAVPLAGEDMINGRIGWETSEKRPERREYGVILGYDVHRMNGYDEVQSRYDKWVCATRCNGLYTMIAESDTFHK
jgi:hypothetical protein